MERTQELFERIDDYLNNRLEGDDLLNFEKSLQLDEKLKDEVGKYTLIRESLSDEDSINFRRTLIEIDQNISVEDQEKEKVIPLPVVKKPLISWKIAAVFIAVIGLSSALLFWSPNEENLFAQHYTPYPTKDLTRGDSSSSGNKEFTKAISNYNNKNYQEAITLLENNIEDFSTDERLKLYLGNSYLNTNQEKKAISIFNSFKKDSKYYRDAQWFSALTYLKINENEMAKTILEDLSTVTSLYKNKALTILKDLR